MHANATRPTELLGLSLSKRFELAQRLPESVRDELETAPLTSDQIIRLRETLACIDRSDTVCEPLDTVISRLRGAWAMADVSHRL